MLLVVSFVWTQLQMVVYQECMLQFIYLMECGIVAHIGLSLYGNRAFEINSRYTAVTSTSTRSNSVLGTDCKAAIVLIRPDKQVDIRLITPISSTSFCQFLRGQFQLEEFIVPLSVPFPARLLWCLYAIISSKRQCECPEVTVSQTC